MLSTVFLSVFVFVLSVFGNDAVFEDQYRDLHHRMDEKDLQTTFGVNSREKVPEYEVTTLNQSYETGNLGNRVDQKQTRTRRRTKEPNVKYFKVQAFGRSLHLKVTRVRPQISSQAVVQMVDDNDSSTYGKMPRGVYYTGHVVSDPRSLVAVSESKGLAGLIRTSDDTFYIQPLAPHLAKNAQFEDHPRHMIFRQPVKEDLSSDYHVSGKGDRTKSNAEANQRHKRQRQAPPDKFLEIALIADNYAISAYDEDGIKRHMLTLTHIVTQLCQDSSIGSIKVTPVVVRMVLKKNGFGYDSSASLSTRIRALEVWAAENLPHSDQDPGHPDAIVLITKGISGGIASTGSTCSSTFGAAVTNDAGLGTAVIMAHELAHTMGVEHDETPCTNNRNIMASVIASGPGSMKWSACSRQKFQEFLSHSSDCLNDRPSISAIIHEPKELYGKLPGQVVSRDDQCKKIYGPRYFACPQRRDSCGALGCTTDGYTCIFSTTSPADGTRCGDRHWCINGECVDDGSRVIDGRWSNWSAFSSCTRPCGGGVQFKTRTCTNPPPKNGGKKCIGVDKGQWKICNPQPCPAGTKSFRQLQCEEIDPTYVAHFDKAKCSLTCRKGQTAFPQGKHVKDGTRCTWDPTNRDVCIMGRCKPVGCDYGLESGMKRDRCGVCDGDSSKCQQVQRFWNEHCPGFGPENACTILEVRVGSTSVYIKQDTADRNLLGVKNQEGQYVIGIPSWSRTVFAAGTKIHYYHEQDNDINKIYIPGPTTERLTIVFVPGYPKTGVLYRLFDPTLSSTVGVEHVQWKVSAWGQCSRKCAKGKQKRSVECARIDDGSHVADTLCLRKGNKPVTKRPCNTAPCQPEWYQSGWSPCSRTCGKGIQKRRIYCRRRITQVRHQKLSDSSCSGAKPPGPTQQTCNAIICHAEWMPTTWSECSSTCGGGVKTRNLICKRRNDLGRIVSAPGIHCHHAPKLQITMDCNSDVPCSKHFRGLGCFNDDRRDHAVPDLVRNFRSHIVWSNITKTINECAEYVRHNYPKYRVFALQFYGECWTGSKAEYTYYKYGASGECWKKVGKEHTNYVYSFD